MSGPISSVASSVVGNGFTTRQMSLKMYASTIKSLVSGTYITIKKANW